MVLIKQNYRKGVRFVFREKKAFTLIEVLIVVIIIGVLAAVAVPTYEQTIETSFGDQAKVVLRVIYTAQRMYRSDANTYNASLDPLNAASLVSLDYLEDPNAGSAKFAYSITASGANTFTARATRKGKNLTIDQTGQIAGTYP